MGSRKSFVVMAVLAIASMSSAWATGTPVEPGASTNVHAEASAIGIGGAGGHGGAAHASATGGAGGQSSAHQTQTAAGGSASQSQTATASNAGNAQSTAITTSYDDRLQAPGLSAPSVFASGPCANGWSAGLSVPGGAITGGKAKADPNCDRREVARILLSISPALALKVLCADPYVKEVAAKEDCIYSEPEPLTFIDPTLFVTRDELAQVRQDSQTAIDRAFRQTQKK